MASRVSFLADCATACARVVRASVGARDRREQEVVKALEMEIFLSCERSLEGWLFRHRGAARGATGDANGCNENANATIALGLKMISVVCVRSVKLTLMGR